MKRLAVVVLVTALAGIVLATWGGAASAREAGRLRRPRRSRSFPRCRPTSRQRGRFNIAVKCDSPPFGYIDVRGRQRRLRRRDRTLVLAVRVRQAEPRHLHLRDDALTRAGTDDRPRGHGHRDVHLHTGPRHADRLLACLLQGHGPLPRAEQRARTSCCRSSPGKTVATTSGSIYDRWVKNCFKDTKLVVTDSFTNALLAFRDGRADALMWDDTVLLGIAVADRTPEADQRHVPGAAVRHRDQAGQHGAQGVGRLTARRS